MSKSVKVSVIVPVYNVEQYLTKCLDSLVNQTLEEIEILVVNDGSPDHSQVIIDDYAARYPNKIRSFIKENGGLSDARNYGAKQAIGEYIGFVDSDDYVKENMFELLYNKATAEDSDTVACGFCKFYEDGTNEPRSIKHSRKHFGQSVEESPRILLKSKSYAWNKLYRREWYLVNNFAFPANQWFEDSAVIYNMLYLANRVSAVSEVLYMYRADRQDSITHICTPKVFDIFKSIESIHDFFYSHTCNPSVLKVADRLCQIHAFARMNLLVQSNSVKLKHSYYKAMMEWFNRYIPNWASNPYYKKAKKPTIYHRHMHIPWRMYILLLLPHSLVDFIETATKRSSH